jgi:hypothetical protein
MTFKSILEPSFKYRNAASTDVSKTFERIRREQRQGTSASQNSDNARAKVVATIGRAQGSLQSTR